MPREKDRHGALSPEAKDESGNENRTDITDVRVAWANALSCLRRGGCVSTSSTMAKSTLIELRRISSSNSQDAAFKEPPSLHMHGFSLHEHNQSIYSMAISTTSEPVFMTPKQALAITHPIYAGTSWIDI